MASREITPLAIPNKVDYGPNQNDINQSSVHLDDPVYNMPLHLESDHASLFFLDSLLELIKSPFYKSF